MCIFKNLYLFPPLPPWSGFLRITWDAASRAWSPKDVCRIKHNSQLLGCALFCQFSSVQLLSHVRLFATPWITARQASLSITNSRSPLSSWVIPFSSCPQSLPASESFPMSQLFTWGGQSTGVSASASVLPMNTQDWSPLGWTGWISLQSKGLSRVFANTTVQKH